MRRPLLNALLPLLALCLLLIASRAGAQSTLHFVGEGDEYVGKSQERTLAAADGFRFDATGNSRYLTFQVSGGSGATNETYFLGFALPLRSSLTPGNYPNATFYRGFDQADGPGVTFSADYLAWQTVTGRFQILEASFDADYHVVSFAANFALHRDGRKTAVYGEIRYNSTVPSTTPAGVAELSADNARVLSTGGPQIAITVARHGSTSGTLAVDYATADGTDLAGRDYTPVSGTLTWADGDTVDKTITVPVFYAGDPLAGDGTFLLTLSGPGAGTQNQATVTIRNDDSAVTFIHFESDPGDPIGNGEEHTLNLDGQWNITPGHGSYGENLSFDATDSLGTKYPDSAQYHLDLATGAGPNPAAGDYQATKGDPPYLGGGPSISFYKYGSGVGRLTGNFQVLEAEYDASGNLLKFAVNFEQHDQGNLAAVYGQVRYNSTVPLPPPRGTRVGVAATVGYTYDFADSEPAVFTITRSGSTAEPLTVYYKVAGTALGGRDYVALKGKRKLAAGKTSAKVTVRAINTGPAMSSREVALKLKLLASPDGSYGVVDTVKPAKVTITHWGR